MRPNTTSLLLLVTLAAILAPLAFSQQASATVEPAPFSDGTHLVGTDISPATYVAEFDEGICFVTITKNGELERNPTFINRAIITITDQDTQVETSGCGEWHPRPSTRPRTLPAEFGPGAYQVGVDIAPGIYTADQNDGRCLWFTLDDFTHHPNPDQVLNWWKVGQPVVQLTKEDNAIYSIRCGSWHRRFEPKPELPLTEFKGGSHLVNIDIAPGTYIANSGEEDCNWFRTTTFGGSTADDSGGYVSTGQQIATILPSDTGFFSAGCGTWQPIAKLDTQPEPASSIAQGTFAVGLDIQPGIYVADADDGRLCRWFFLSGFAGRPSDIITSGNGLLRGIAQIPAQATGFRSINCGEWQLIDPTDTALSTTTFGDGEHVVNVHIKPGVYAAPGPATGRCSWRRLTGFVGTESDHIAVRNPVGRNIAEITENDAIFKSYGCGTWEPLGVQIFPDPLTDFVRGTWAVNTEIKPGTYTAVPPEGSTCFWSRLSAFTGQPEDFEATVNSVGHAVTTVQSFDTGFYSDGCGTWTPVPEDAPATDLDPVTEFKDGVYVTKHNIAPGTYIADGIEGEICFWSRLSSFDGDTFNRINLYASAGQSIATILEADAGFRSFGCGTWRQIQTDDSSTNTTNTVEESPPSKFSDGTYRIGVDIAAGTYIASRSPHTTCKWRRLNDFTWTSGVIVETKASGTKIATLKESDIGFSSFGCGEWVLLTDETSNKSETFPTRFSGGSYLVGVHIEPGTYYAVPPPRGGCRWSRVSDFTGDPADTIASGFSRDRWVVTIHPEDVGFVTTDCSLWRNVEIALKIGPFDKFDDGVYRVNEDIVPGTYVARVPTQPFLGGRPVPKCAWQRLSGFSHSPSDLVEIGSGKGKIEVTIAETDSGFQSQGCGEWKNVDKNDP